MHLPSKSASGKQAQGKQKGVSREARRKSQLAFPRCSKLAPIAELHFGHTGLPPNFTPFLMGKIIR